MKTLHISLGHNASAVLTDSDGNVVRGYEQERLDRIKGSSHFPALAICAALAEDSADQLVISNWSDSFDPLRTEHKRYSAEFIRSRFSANSIEWSSRQSVTHHDMHAQSVRAFFRAHTADTSRPYVTIVCDGFGNGQECLSVYRDGRLLHRTFGYEMSLGLMYQYTTGYLGMKENEDEYKLLGYEVHASSILGRAATLTLYDKALAQGNEFALRMLQANARPLTVIRGPDDELDYDALLHAKHTWRAQADQWRLASPIALSSDSAVRAVVALQAQAFLEGALQAIVGAFVGPEDDLLLAGGVFYNVKLNNRILNMRQGGRVCAHPLSGDQGAALGLKGGPHGGLRWGERVIVEPQGNTHPNVLMLTEDTWAQRVADLVNDNRIVNVVRGAAEYGPRALCNTTTFAMPTLEMVGAINKLNARNDVMPMAPVIREETAESYFYAREYARVVGSSQYMVMTHEIRDSDFPSGVTHPDPINPFRRTARPQIVPKGYDSQLEQLLLSVQADCLINTSYNFHGEPIVHSTRDAVATHTQQLERARLLGLQEPYLVLVLS